MMKLRKAQISVEFLTAIILLILVVIAMTYYIAEKTFESSSIKAKMEAEKICLDISNTINTASYSEGYYSEFNLPLTVSGFEYNLTIFNKTIGVDYTGHSCIANIRTQNIVYKGSFAPFSLCGGIYYINNVNGTVYIDNLSVTGC
jgi:uncharacterized protein (UPF0333 family)